MKRHKAENLADVVRAALRMNGLEGPLNEYRLIQSWPVVAGDDVARLTDKLSVRNGVLVVRLKSPALRANLLMQRGRLVELLNAEVGSTVVTDIVFR